MLSRTAVKLAQPAPVPTADSLADLETSAPKFPHTRAQLAAIARLHKPDSFTGDPEGGELSSANSSLVARVVNLLDDEREDELKGLLRETFGPIGSEEVRIHTL